MKQHFGKLGIGTIALAWTLSVSVASDSEAAPAWARFATPMQPWVSPDGNIHLLRPITVVPTLSSLQLGPIAKDQVLRPANVKLPPGSVAPLTM